MSQFAFTNELNNCLKMDGPLTKGPLPRWQRKCLESSTSSNTSLNISKSKLSTSVNASFSKSPNKLNNSSAEGLVTKKSPSRTPGAKTPHGGDRFIPVRSTTNFELGHFKLPMDEATDDGDKLRNCSIEEKGYEVLPDADKGNKMKRKGACLRTCTVVDLESMKILSYRSKAPQAPD
ncbi:hypothetical protein L9F63_025518, partial [Diploptera punctata]